MDLNKVCKFIPFDGIDDQQFSYLDRNEGLNCCAYVEGGVVGSNADYDSYLELMKKAKEYFHY